MNRTHLVWSGEASPALQRLLDMLVPLDATTRRAKRQPVARSGPDSTAPMYQRSTKPTANSGEWQGTAGT